MKRAAPLDLVIVEDNPDDAELMVIELRRFGFDVRSRRVDNAIDFVHQMSNLPDVILCDYSLPSFGAIPALQQLAMMALELPVIVVTGTIGDEAAAECIRLGASDYILKDRLGRLGQAVLQACEKSRLNAQHKRLQAELLEAQKLESVGRLAGGIAHDFNNLLTAMMGFSELMTLRCKLDENAASYLNYITTAAEKAHDLCQQLLAFARRQVIEPKSVNLNGLIHSLEGILGSLVRDSIELLIVPDQGLNPVLVDPGQFEQIIVNLVVNARDAILDIGVITIETHNVTLDSDFDVREDGVESGEYVLLTVSDTGAGMDESTRQHLFEPFFTTKEPGRGTGLGLASSYGIVKQAQGHIALSSEPGKGTTFRIYLPVTALPLDTATPRGEAIFAGGSETILLVEEQQAVRALICATLRGLGYTVIETARIEEAAREEFESIDLLIAGARNLTPEGADIAASVRSRMPITRILCISNDPVKWLQEWEGPTSDIRYLKRPFTPTLLAQKVRGMLHFAGPRATP